VHRGFTTIFVGPTSPHVDRFFVLAEHAVVTCTQTDVTLSVKICSDAMRSKRLLHFALDVFRRKKLEKIAK